MGDRKGKTILLVEDETILALVERRALERLGYVVLPAASGEEAIEAFAAGREIDLVLMDIDLGEGMDGTEASSSILSMKEVPIIFLTAHAEQPMVERVRGITRYGYVIKNSGTFVLESSIEMAFELFEANRDIVAKNERLRESEENYRRLVESVPGIIYRYSSQRGGVYYSGQIEKLLGYSSEFLYQHPFLWNESIHPEDKAKVNAAIAAFLAGGDFDIEYRIRDARGEWLWFNDRNIGKPAFGEETLVEGIAIDITARKKMEQSGMAQAKPPR